MSNCACKHDLDCKRGFSISLMQFPSDIRKKYSGDISILQNFEFFLKKKCKKKGQTIVIQAYGVRKITSKGMNNALVSPQTITFPLFETVFQLLNLRNF